MNSKYVVVVAALALMLVAATAIGTTDSAFADKKRKGGYDKSQAVAQVNDCGNGGEDRERPNGASTIEVPIEGMAENVGCQNTASQIQGDDNVAALASEQEFGDD
jgi:hypothetical protein